MKNKDVVRSWFRGDEASSTNMHTDGKDLFSYQLLIGSFVEGEAVIMDYTKENSVSHTTSRHVNLAATVTGASRVKPN
jgi:hypothetical protein